MREGGRRGRKGCRYDARAQPRAARGMPRSEGRRPASDGADVGQRRETAFRFWPFLELSKMEVAMSKSIIAEAPRKGWRFILFTASVFVYGMISRHEDAMVHGRMHAC